MCRLGADELRQCHKGRGRVLYDYRKIHSLHSYTPPPSPFVFIAVCDSAYICLYVFLPELGCCRSTSPKIALNVSIVGHTNRSIPKLLAHSQTITHPACSLYSATLHLSTRQHHQNKQRQRCATKLCVSQSSTKNRQTITSQDHIKRSICMPLRAVLVSHRIQGAV